MVHRPHTCLLLSKLSLYIVYQAIAEVDATHHTLQDMLEKSKKHFGEALANAGQAADAAAKRQLNE